MEIKMTTTPASPLPAPGTTRRSLFKFGGAALAAGATASLLPTIARASAPATTAVGGFYKRKLGDFTVTALLDGYIDLGVEFFTGVDRSAIETALMDAFHPFSDKVRAAVTSYAIETGKELILVDTGAGGSLGPSSSKFLETFKAAGFAPESVDRILITHMHPDHIWDLVDGGKVRFPKAVLNINALDHAFWTDEGNLSRAEATAKPWFTRAQEVSKAYGGQLELFTGAKEFLAGVRSEPLHGHTPGQSGFRIESAGQQLFFMGDTASMQAVHFRHPEAGLVFDIDGEASTATRKRMLDMLAADRTLTAGAHMSFPSFGYIARSGGAYAWVQEDWQFT
jgi:glyoxylase-like metal-dependent hydrolase (beta-lactamase superfamily II)